MQDSPSQSIAVPIAIVIGFGLIAVAIFLSGSNASAPAPATNTVGSTDTAQPAAAMAPVTADDHIRGNPNAPILLVEYSDYDCPFCKNFHDTLTRVMAEYGTQGKVAWVYRQFPLQQLHPNAPLIAHASECVAELGGNDAFWKFTDLVFNERGTNEQTNMTKISDFAVSAGVDKTAFESCNESGRHQDDVTNDLQDAVATGGRGTPHTIVLVGDQQAVITGAQPYSEVKRILDNLIDRMEGASPEDLENQG